MRLHDVLFKLLVDSGSAKTPQQPKPTHLLTARKPVHEDGGRDHDAPVVTAEKVVIAEAKGEGLDCHVRDVARKNVVAMVPRQRLQDQEVYHPHAEVRQSCLPRLARKRSHRDNLEGH